MIREAGESVADTVAHFMSAGDYPWLLQEDEDGAEDARLLRLEAP